MLLQHFVKITKDGRITIPKEFREKYGIKASDKIVIKICEEGLVLQRIPHLLELAGYMVDYATPRELKKELEKIREEY